MSCAPLDHVGRGYRFGMTTVSCFFSFLFLFPARAHPVAAFSAVSSPGSRKTKQNSGRARSYTRSSRLCAACDARAARTLEAALTSRRPETHGIAPWLVERRRRVARLSYLQSESFGVEVPDPSVVLPSFCRYRIRAALHSVGFGCFAFSREYWRFEAVIGWASRFPAASCIGQGCRRKGKVCAVFLETSDERPERRLF